MIWKYLKLFIFTSLFCLKIALADESLLPDRFPQDLNSAEKIEALKQWVNLREKNPYTNLHAEYVAVDGKVWLNIYYELEFTLFEPRELNKLEDQIKSMLKIYNSAGYEIRVIFNPYIIVHDVFSQTTLLTIGEKRNADGFDHTFDSMTFHVPHVGDPVWRRNRCIFPNGQNRSFVLFEENIGYINLRNDPVLPHELNHLLLHNGDAYCKNQPSLTEENAQQMTELNAHKSREFIHPLEIYIGLKGYGYTAPGWDDYVNRTHIVQPTIRNQLILHTRRESSITANILSIKFFDITGKKIKEDSYCTDACMGDEILVDHLPTNMDLTSLGQGTYLIQSRLSQSGKQNILGQKFFFSSVYRNISRVVVQ